MIFRETKLPGAFIIEVQRLDDDRGFFGRSFCRHEFTGRGLNPEVAQCNISFNRDAGTLRGMHYQATPHAEEKMVRCTRGSLYDVIIDLRQGVADLQTVGCRGTERGQSTNALYSQRFWPRFSDPGGQYRDFLPDVRVLSSRIGLRCPLE